MAYTHCVRSQTTVKCQTNKQINKQKHKALFHYKRIWAGQQKENAAFNEENVMTTAIFIRFLSGVYMCFPS